MVTQLQTLESEMETEKEEKVPFTARLKDKGCLAKFIFLLLLVVFIIYVIIDTFTTGHIKDLLTQFLEQVEKLGFGGVVLFTVVYIVATVLLIPGTILTLGAGFVFTQTNGGNQAIGTLIATCAVFIGATVGATCAYLVARYLLRDTVSGWTTKYRVFNAIDRAIEHNGIKIVFLLRLSPALPFNVLNYLLGVTSVSLRDYVIACIGLLPGTIAFCFVGSTLGSLGDVEEQKGMDDGSGKAAKTIVLIIGAIASILAIVCVTIYARKELQKHLDAAEAEDVSDASVAVTPRGESSTDYVQV